MEHRKSLFARCGTLPREATVLALALLLVVPPSPAAAVAPSPSGELRTAFAAANRVLNDPSTEDQPIERLQSILAVVSGVFAFRDAAEAALGRDWQARTAAERDEFTRLFANLLERSFVYTLAARAKLDGGMDVGPLRESIEDAHATVRGTVAARDGTAIPIEYRMVRHDRRWMIWDVVIDGMSVIDSYRVQIARVIETSSFESLVSRMRARLGTPALVPATEVDVVAHPKADAALGRGERAAAPSHREGAIADGDVLETVVLPPPRSDEGAPSRETRVAVAPAAPPRPAPAVPIVHEAPAVSPLASDHASRYWVQVGAFRDRATARHLGERLRGEGFRVSLDDANGGDALVRVRVGPFAYRSAAVAILHRLEARRFTPFVLTTR